MGQAWEWWRASRRRRRRITWFAIVAAAAGAVASLVVWMRDTGTSVETPVRPGAVQVYRQPKQIRVSARALQAARLTTYAFLRTAVLRDHVDESWALIAPALRKGYTRTGWAKGDIPVVPYPVDLKAVRYRLDYAYASGGPDGLPLLGLEVAMKPKAGQQVPQMRFGIELEAIGNGPSRHWAVSEWGPRGELGGEPQGHRGAAPGELPAAHPLSSVWLFVPAALLGAFFVIPLAYGMRSWMRHRRIMRDAGPAHYLPDRKVTGNPRD
jgi:hypothetical protein